MGVRTKEEGRQGIACQIERHLARQVGLVFALVPLSSVVTHLEGGSLGEGKFEKCDIRCRISHFRYRTWIQYIVAASRGTGSECWLAPISA